MKFGDTLNVLFSHNLWATLKLLGACASLTDEQMQSTYPGAFGTLQVTLEHIVTSEQSYFSRISTGKRSSRPASTPPMTIPEMMEMTRATGNGLLEWVQKVQPDDTVEVDWDGQPRAVPKTILLLQVIEHAHEHREQVKSILTLMGIEPPDLQGWEYFDVMDR